MQSIEIMLDQIQPLELGHVHISQEHQSQLTKPPGSLGRLEEISSWYVQVTGKFPPLLPIKKVIFTMASDHGVVEEKVSAYPKEVTSQMVYNFLSGGAAINVLARHVGSDVRVVDMGVDHDFGNEPGLIHRKISSGTRNMAHGPSMTTEEALASVSIGFELAKEAGREGINLIGTGDMGIGNTTASSAMTSVMTHSPVGEVTGKGTGIDDQTLLNKRAIIEQALQVNRPNPDRPMDVLSKVGGYEIGGIVGIILGGAAHRIPVLVDGFISTAAALIAVALKPEVRNYLLAAHQSAEPGHQVALSFLGLRPLLDLQMRLGEGTGCALGMGLVEASIRILTEMATFGQARVSQSEPKK